MKLTKTIFTCLRNSHLWFGLKSSYSSPTPSLCSAVRPSLVFTCCVLSSLIFLSSELMWVTCALYPLCSNCWWKWTDPPECAFVGSDRHVRWQSGTALPAKGLKKAGLCGVRFVSVVWVWSHETSQPNPQTPNTTVISCYLRLFPFSNLCPCSYSDVCRR